MQVLLFDNILLSFQEDEDYALYCDAHIVDIQRKLHDIEGCRCIFVVRYVTDDFEVSRLSLSIFYITMELSSNSSS